MSFSIKQFITGIGLKPVSADPSNPTQGQLQYADGTVRAEGLWRYDGSAWQQVGSGAGSYDIFFQENLETNSASNFTTGQAASPDAAGTGTLGGTLANEESSQISGDRSLKYTMNATASSSNNDFIINDTDIALDAKQKGNFIGVSFYYTYTGADDDIRFFVLDQDDNELTQSDEYIKANTNPTRFSTSVFIPSSDTALRYGFQVVTGNSSKVFIVDDIEFSTNPFVYKELQPENIFSAKISSSDVVSDENEPFIESVSSASTGTYVVTFKSGFFTETPNIIVQARSDDRIVYITSQSSTSFTYEIVNSSDVLLNDSVNILVQKTGADYQAPAEHVVTPAKSNINDFSARIANNGTATITTQGGENEKGESAIASVNRSSAGSVDITFTTDFFSVAPSVIAIPDGPTGNKFASVNNISTTGCSIDIDADNGTGTDHDFCIIISRQGTDVKNAQFLAAVPMNYTQTKYLTADVSVTTADITDLRFDNLVIGKTYRIDFQGVIAGSSSGDFDLVAQHDGVDIAACIFDSYSGQFQRIAASSYAVFTATASSLTFRGESAGMTLEGNVSNTGRETFATLTELNYTKETTRFT